MTVQSKKLYLLFIVIITLVIIGSDYNPFIIKANMEDVTVQDKDPLYNQIKESANKYNESPKNAYIDRVWKKTPGRNGREVNVEESYKKMKQEGEFTPSLLVFDQTAPKITLRNLQSAPIYRGHPEKQMISLMINVSWGEEYIPSILQTLKKTHVKATFFIEGKWALKNKNIVKMIHEQDHLIGNHAYNHPNMANLSTSEMHQQIDETNDILEAIIDYRPVWFAPPSGSFNDQVVKQADLLEMETVLWTVDTIDWKNPSVSVMINRVKDNVHPGATVLMHPTEVVAEGLEEMIHSLKELDFEIGTIDSLLSEKR